MFPDSMRGLSIAALDAAGYLGAGLASLSVPLVKKSGWRTAFRLFGSFGLLVSLISLVTLKDPR